VHSKFGLRATFGSDPDGIRGPNITVQPKVPPEELIGLAAPQCYLDKSSTTAWRFMLPANSSSWQLSRQ
jgi:hypothetical protein